MRKTLFVLILLIVIISGCIQTPSEKIVREYVCPDGLVVDDPAKCTIEEVSEEKQEDCVPFWNCIKWSECSLEGKQSRTCTDKNSCGTDKDKPEEEQSCNPPCIPEWNCGEWSDCTTSNSQTRICIDSRNCNVLADKPIESQYCTYTPPKDCAKIIEKNEMTTFEGSHFGNKFTILGKVQNNCGKLITFTKINFILYDVEGKMIKTDFIFTSPYDIPDGYTAPFEMYWYYGGASMLQIATKPAKYDISLEYR